MDRIVAIDLYTMGSKSLCAWNGGFLAEIEHCSPGKFLINAGIRMACELQLEEYDFMRGIEAYKSYWSNTHRSIGQVTFNTATGLLDQPLEVAGTQSL
jgi:CelD/BcsL family acetyltransferase involved in cellulose biosynthesis